MSASPDVNSSDLVVSQILIIVEAQTRYVLSNSNATRSGQAFQSPFQQKHRPLNHRVAIAIADYYGPAQLS